MRTALLENGFFWTTHLILYYAASSIADSVYTRMNQLRTKRDLPGIHSVAMNREIWRSWDWESGGEEWTPSVEWKKSLTDSVLLKYMTKGGRILEVGPGAGRWTETLQKIAGHLIAIDISDRCIEICKRKFAGCDNAEFLVSNGSEVPLVEDDSIDSIWSFDVFVHINAPEAGEYVKEFKRVLRAGGHAAIHHGQDGGVHGGWRSNLTSKTFRAILEANGFRILTQFAEWRDGEQVFKISQYGDLLTVFENPG
ncbi:MAG: class I SAM-dependent methyltransferase [Pyrinomonadaceae bacterium]|nr:class I SAM-dependent methyltransferase [Pyrinomonadaceae bacterium]